MSPPVEPPRRAPLTTEQRERNARAANGVQIAEGATGEAKRVDRTSSVRVYQAPSTDTVLTGAQTDDTGISITSTVAGSGTSSATGADAIAIGDTATAEVAGAIAIGSNSDARADNTVAVGNYTSANVSGGTAVGYGTTTASGYATAIGYVADAGGGHSAAVGFGSKTDGDKSVALGALAEAVGIGCIAIGTSSGTLTGSGVKAGDVSEYYAIALGQNAVAAKAGSVAIGTDHTGAGAAASVQDEIRLGTANHIAVIEGKLVIKDSSGGGFHQIVCSSSGVLSTVVYP